MIWAQAISYTDPLRRMQDARRKEELSRHLSPKSAGKEETGKKEVENERKE